MLTIGFLPGKEFQDAFGNQQALVWRNDVNLIGFYASLVSDLAHRHRGRFSEQFRERTFMNWVEMLDQDKSHACVDLQVIQ